jgi:hypothetical protein
MFMSNLDSIFILEKEVSSLIEFKSMVRGIDMPHKRSYESICKSLMCGLHMDSETHVLSL